VALGGAGKRRRFRKGEKISIKKMSKEANKSFVCSKTFQNEPVRRHASKSRLEVPHPES
jgi:hypothetical protein